MKSQNGLYGVLRGSFLTSEQSGGNWRVIVFVVSLLLVMVWSGHSVDEKVVLIAALNKEKRELRAEYVDTKTSLARMKLESSVVSRVKSKGLLVGDVPPQKIKVIVKQK